MIRKAAWIALILSILGGLARAEDVERHGVETCRRGRCFLIYDVPAAVENVGGLVPVVSIRVQSYGLLKIDGEPGMDQPKAAKALYCGINPDVNLRASCDLTDLSFALGQAVKAPAGIYILSYSGTQSAPVRVEENGMTTIVLKKLFLERVFDSESTARRITADFAVGRDLSNIVEQDKFLFGVGALRINRQESVNLCGASDLSVEGRAACQALFSSADARDLRNILVRFRNSSSWYYYGLNVRSWMQTNILSFMRDIVTEINGDSTSFVSVFPGAYEVSYYAGRSAYLVKNYVVQLSPREST